MGVFLDGLNNWKTTILGALAMLTGIVTRADELAHGDNTQKIQILTAAIGAFLLGFFAKDADKTGVSPK